MFCGHGRLRARRVDVGDQRDPMTRLLEDGLIPEGSPGAGTVEVSYDQQWRTLWKAKRMGYLDESSRLTDKGREFLAKGA